MVRHRYADSPTRSAELLRLALPLMSRQKAAPHPLRSAVWYEHVAGTNRALSEAIAELTRDGQPLDDEQTTYLYDHFVLSADEQAAQRVADGVRGLLGEMAVSASRAGEQAQHFDASLARWHDDIQTGRATEAPVSERMRAETQAMRESVGELQAQLATSQREIEQLRREIERSRDEALLDSLTGLGNRRAFDPLLLEAANRGEAGACLLVCDIDHFKKINDSFGHLFGDQVLKVVAKAIQASLRDGSHAARVGGEEFAVLLPRTTLAEGQIAAERVRATVAASRIRKRESNQTIGQVTISIGLAAQMAGESADAWFERADRALYASKQGGRNRVTVAAEAPALKPVSA